MPEKKSTGTTRLVNAFGEFAFTLNFTIIRSVELFVDVLIFGVKVGILMPMMVIHLVTNRKFRITKYFQPLFFHFR